MKRETPLTEATERALTKSRMISNGNLLQGGAELAELANNEQLLLTEQQIEEARRMMKEELADKNYKDTAEINGMKIDIWWSDKHKGYMIAFRESSVYENRLLIGQDEQVARVVFDYAKRQAGKTESAKKLYETVDRHIIAEGKFDFNISDFYWDINGGDNSKKDAEAGVQPATYTRKRKNRAGKKKI